MSQGTSPQLGSGRGWGQGVNLLGPFSLHADSENLRYFLKITQHVQTQGQDWNPGWIYRCAGKPAQPQGEGRGEETRCWGQGT